jgi:AraC family transcriptional regulator
LAAEFRAPPGLAALGHMAGVHPVHLARSFGSHYGCSPGEYVRALRIEEAKARLQDSKEPLAEIAVACGFSDQSHFSTAFRRAVGVSPGAYRKRALQR